ncbi:hypothetical protein BASA60_007112 [Batrachochytrium salamandrivorans]|nr:hypothetical protein BASA60_007112 [Batrachochytrium salamandrivorans]
MSTVLAAAKRIIPLFDRVMVQRIKPAERTASGLFIPEKAQETLNEALVIAVGPGAPDKDGVVRPVSVKAGEHVLLPPYGGNCRQDWRCRVFSIQGLGDSCKTGILNYL